MNAIYQPLEVVINTYLDLDERSKQKRHQLNGKVIKIDIKALSFYLKFDEDKIRLLDSTETPTNTTISGHPIALLSLATQQKSPLSLFESEISIQGDIELGQQIQKLFNELDIDWEEHLSHITGDIFAHEAIKTLKAGSQFFNKTSLNTQQNITEFLQEELRALPPKEETQDFFNDVDTLRLRLDRLNARVQRLLREER